MSDLLIDPSIERNNNQMNNNDGERLLTAPTEPTAMRPPARVIKRLSPEDRCVILNSFIGARSQRAFSI